MYSVKCPSVDLLNINKAFNQNQLQFKKKKTFGGGRYGAITFQKPPSIPGVARLIPASDELCMYIRMIACESPKASQGKRISWSVELYRIYSAYLSVALGLTVLREQRNFFITRQCVVGFVREGRESSYSQTAIHIESPLPRIREGDSSSLITKEIPVVCGFSGKAGRCPVALSTTYY